MPGVRPLRSDAPDAARRTAGLHRTPAATAPLLHPDLGLRRALHARARSVLALEARLAHASPRAVRLRRSPSGRRLAPSEDRRRRRPARVLRRHRSDRAIAGTRSAHRVEEPARTSAGEAVRPVSRSSGHGQRDRWRRASASWRAIAGAHWARSGCRRFAPSDEDLWPADVTPDLTDVDVAIARTVPELRDAAGRSASARRCSSIRSPRAKRSIYIESQYFTNDSARRRAGRASARTGRPGGRRRLAGGMPRLARAEHDGRVSRQRVPAS